MCIWILGCKRAKCIQTHSPFHFKHEMNILCKGLIAYHETNLTAWAYNWAALYKKDPLPKQRHTSCFRALLWKASQCNNMSFRRVTTVVLCFIHNRMFQSTIYHFLFVFLLKDVGILYITNLIEVSCKGLSLLLCSWEYK